MYLFNTISDANTNYNYKKLYPVEQILVAVTVKPFQTPE